MERITISSKIDSTFEFEMTAVGVDLDLSETTFQTEVAAGIQCSVICKNKSGHLWSVTIPKGLIPNGSYNYSLCVVAEEFLFKPVKGKLNVVSAETIEVVGVPVKTELQHPVVTPDDTVKPVVAKESVSPIQKIKDQINERQATRIPAPAEAKEVVEEDNKPKYQFFQTDEQVKEEKFAKRKFDTIYPVDDMPTSVKPKEVVEEEEEEEKTIGLEEILQKKLGEVITEKEIQQEEIFEEPEEEIVEDEPLATPSLDESTTPDANEKVKNILLNVQGATKVTPTPEIALEGTQMAGTDGSFFKEVEEMKRANKRHQKNRDVKNIIRKPKKD